MFNGEAFIKFDEKSKLPEYSARKEIGPTARYRRIWTTRFDPLCQDVGDSSVGFAGAGLLSSRPIKHIVSNESARTLNRKAEDNSILGLMSACVGLGLFGRYVWNFGIEDTIDWIIRKGPAILGLPWYESMMTTDENGLLRIDGGRKVGRHAIMANGYWPAHPFFGEVLVLTNSWGIEWGQKGRAYLPIDSARKLLQESGESVGAIDIPPRRTVDE